MSFFHLHDRFSPLEIPDGYTGFGVPPRSRPVTHPRILLARRLMRQHESFWHGGNGFGSPDNPNNIKPSLIVTPKKPHPRILMARRLMAEYEDFCPIVGFDGFGPTIFRNCRNRFFLLIYCTYNHVLNSNTFIISHQKSFVNIISSPPPQRKSNMCYINRCYFLPIMVPEKNLLIILIDVISYR